MKIVFKTKSLQEALEKISRISKMEYACLKVEGSDIYIYSNANMQYIKLHVDSKIAAKSKVKSFSFNIRTLQRLTKQSKSDTVTVEVKGKKLTFLMSEKNSKIRGEFQIISDVEAEQELDKKNSVKMSRNHIRAITKGIKYIGIKSLHTTTLDLPLYIVFNTEGMHMYMSDGYHFAYILDKKFPSKKEIKFDMPAVIYSNIEYISGGNPFNLTLHESHVHAHGTGFEVSFPILQHMRADRIELSKIMEHSDAAFPQKKEDKKFRRIKIPMTRLDHSVKNMNVISEGSNIIQFKSNNTNLMLSIQSQLGKISELTNLKIANWKTSDTFLVNEVLLKDILSLYPKTDKPATIYFKADDSRIMSTKYVSKDMKVVYVCALISEK